MANIIKVSPNGDITFRQAYDQAKPGDHIVLESGKTYDFAKTGTFSEIRKHGLTIRTDGEKRATVFTGSESLLFTFNRGPISDFSISGINAISQRKQGEYPSGIAWHASGSGLNINNCSFDGYTMNLDLQNASDVSVLDSELINSWGNESAGRHSSGIYAYLIDGLTIRGNLFDHNGWSETESTAPRTKFNHGLYVKSECTGVVVEYNQFRNNSAHGAQVRSGGIIADNSFIGNSYSFYSPSGIIHGNACIEQREIWPGTGSVSGITAQFVNKPGDKVVISNNLVAENKNTGYAFTVEHGALAELRDNAVVKWQLNVGQDAYWYKDEPLVNQRNIIIDDYTARWPDPKPEIEEQYQIMLARKAGSVTPPIIIEPPVPVPPIIIDPPIVIPPVEGITVFPKSGDKFPECTIFESTSIRYTDVEDVAIENAIFNGNDPDRQAALYLDGVYDASFTDISCNGVERVLQVYPSKEREVSGLYMNHINASNMWNRKRNKREVFLIHGNGSVKGVSNCRILNVSIDSTGEIPLSVFQTSLKHARFTDWTSQASMPLVFELSPWECYENVSVSKNSNFAVPIIVWVIRKGDYSEGQIKRVSFPSNFTQYVKYIHGNEPRITWGPFDSTNEVAKFIEQISTGKTPVEQNNRVVGENPARHV